MITRLIWTIWTSLPTVHRKAATFNHSLTLFYYSVIMMMTSNFLMPCLICDTTLPKYDGHHRPRGKTTTVSALDGAVFDIAQILAYLVHNMSRSQLYLGFVHFGWLPSFSVNNILAGLWLNCISPVEIHLFLLADKLLQHRALFQC